MANGYTAADITLLESRLAGYLDAEAAVLRNQAYRMPDRREVTRADLRWIRQGIDDLRQELMTANGTPLVVGRARRGVVLG